MAKARIEVHESHIPLWEETWWRYAIFLGGRGNGRSGTASRFALTSLLGKEYTRGALMRAVREDINATCWAEMQDRVEENNLQEKIHSVQNTMMMKRGKNSLRAFGFRASSGSLKARLKSLANFNFAWIEEFEEIGEAEFLQFDDSLRTKMGRIRIIMTTNPPPKDHWMIKKFFDLTPAPHAPGFYIPTLKEEWKDKVLFIPGTYRENAVNMDPATVERYERYKITNPAYYYQQIEGLIPESVAGRIYTNWKEISAVPHEARLLGYGLDFGFSRDPDAIVAVYYHNGGYILDEQYYQIGTSYEALIDVCKMLKPAPIIADYSDGRMIEALKRGGVNVIETEKGPGSVEYGIKHVQGLPVSYTANSTNLKREALNYAWFIDKDGINRYVPDPKSIYHFGDHLLDATRYYFMKMIKAGANPDADERVRMTSEHQQKKHVQQATKRWGV